MKIRTKIALVFTLLTGTVLLLLSGFVYFVTLSHVHDNFFTRLKVRASISAETNYRPSHGAILKEMRSRHLQRLPREKELYFDKDSTFSHRLSEVLPDVPASFRDEIIRSGTVEYHDKFQHYSAITYSIGNAEHVVVAIAYDENGEGQMSYLLNVLLIGFAASCLIVFGLGRVFAFHIIKPISLINAKVNTITASDLNERLPGHRSSDEIAELSHTFNNMLDRLETAFELQSNFISNASHELRTPLTSILGESEVILGSPRQPSEYVASLQTIQHEAKKLDDVTTSLLKLSQISFDGKRQKMEVVMMDELLVSIKVALDKRMPGNFVKVLIQPTAEDEDLFALVCVRIWIELAITNIIQNSIKYSDNKEVLITLSGDRSGFLVQISDEGIGIPPEELPHILEPFFRASNTTPYSGYGIGLPLAARIIRLHGGSINIVSKEASGTQVSVRFPFTPGIKI